MSRKRLVSPQFFTNADLYDAEAKSGLPLRICFIGLWTVADRRGIFRWSRNLKPDILPYDAVDAMACMEALEAAGFVRSYEINGRKYGIIPTFAQHQTFHLREKPSADPAPPWAVSAPVQHKALTPSSSPESIVPAQGQHSAGTSASPTVTVTGTVTGTVGTTTTPLSPKAAKAPKAAGGGWPAAVAAAWTREVGAITEGRVGGALAGFVRLYPNPKAAEEAAVIAVANYVATCRRRDEPAVWRNFATGIQGHIPPSMKPPKQADAQEAA